MAPDPSVEVYRDRAAEWEADRTSSGQVVAFAGSLDDGDRPVLDLGCGPGWDLPALGEPAIALDAAEPFLGRVATYAPGAWPVQADLRALPFRRHSIGAAWASRSLVHLARSEVPMALWELHRALRVDAPARLVLFPGDEEHISWPGDEFAGRRFSLWPEALLSAVMEGAGFEDVTITAEGTSHLVVAARRGRTLADTVGPGMRMLLSGLNPSWYAADAGVGFARPGNRFWPAALAAGIVSKDRDPAHALRHHGIGMTDLVKRPSAQAKELTAAEFRHGHARLGMMVEMLQPAVVCVVGITGWRAASGDRHAALGLQPGTLGGRPVYVMPNPSGLNAHTNVDDLAEHFRAAVALHQAATSRSPRNRPKGWSWRDSHRDRRHSSS